MRLTSSSKGMSSIAVISIPLNTFFDLIKPFSSTSSTAFSAFPDYSYFARARDTSNDGFKYPSKQYLLFSQLFYLILLQFCPISLSISDITYFLYCILSNFYWNMQNLFALIILLANYALSGLTRERNSSLWPISISASSYMFSS